MEKSPSWSRAHDWKSCRLLKGLEGSNPSFSAKPKTVDIAGKSSNTNGFLAFFDRLLEAVKTHYNRLHEHSYKHRKEAPRLSARGFFWFSQMRYGLQTLS